MTSLTEKRKHREQVFAIFEAIFYFLIIKMAIIGK